MSDIAEKFFADGDNLIHNGVAGNVTTWVGYLPTAGVREICFLCQITMGNSTDVVLTFQTADDTAGTSAAALASNVAIWRDNVRQSDAKAITEGESSGDYVWKVVVPANIIPAGKYIGCYANSGSASNKYTVTALESTYYNP